MSISLHCLSHRGLRWAQNKQPKPNKLVTLTQKCSRVRLKSDGTRWRTGGEVKGKLANGVSSQYSHTPSERGLASLTTTDAHTSAASSRLHWRPRQLKWTRPFRWKMKSGFCACAITFQTHYIAFTPTFSNLTCRLCCYAAEKGTVIPVMSIHLSEFKMSEGFLVKFRFRISRRIPILVKTQNKNNTV